MLRRYLQAGWQIVNRKGSHVRLEKNGDHETIPLHGNRDLGKGLERKLLKHLEGHK